MNQFDLRSDRGASMVEYALLVALISVLSLTAVTLAGARVGDTFDGIADELAAGPDSGHAGGNGYGTPGGGTADEDGSDTGGGGSDDADAPNPGPGDENGCNGKGNPECAGNEKGECKGVGNPNCNGNPGAPGGPGTGSDHDPSYVPEVVDTAAEFHQWTNHPSGGDGQWKASATFENATDQDLTLDLEIVLTDDKGKKVTVVVPGFQVPAGGMAEFTQWENALRLRGASVSGVVFIEIKVMTVHTVDGSGNPVTYDMGGITVAKIAAPPKP